MCSHSCEVLRSFVPLEEEQKEEEDEENISKHQHIYNIYN